MRTCCPPLVALNSALCGNLNVKEVQKRGDICIMHALHCTIETLHNMVNQLYSNKKLFLKRLNYPPWLSSNPLLPPSQASSSALGKLLCWQYHGTVIHHMVTAEDLAPLYPVGLQVAPICTLNPPCPSALPSSGLLMFLNIFASLSLTPWFPYYSLEIERKTQSQES